MSHGRLRLKPPADFTTTYNPRLRRDEYKKAAEELSCELEAAERRILQQSQIIENMLAAGFVLPAGTKWKPAKVKRRRNTAKKQK